MKVKYYVLLVFTVLLINLGNAQSDSVKQVQVDGSMEFQHYEHYKRLVLKTSDPKIEFIEGFVFEWGYHYTLNVVEKQLEIGLSDGTQSRYVLKEVVSKEKIEKEHSFQLYLDAQRYYQTSTDDDVEASATFKKISPGRFMYFDAVIIEIPEHLEKKFLSILDGVHKQKGTFQFTDRNSIRLVSL